MPSRLRAAVEALLLATASTLLTLLALEFVLRMRADSFFEPPQKRFERLQLDLLDSGYPAQYDSLLGYVPREGRHGGGLFPDATIDAHGIRSNGFETPPGVPIIAVGDSFTYGDEVGGDETWPAHLEQAMGRPVLNGGVFGYGFDQIVLRAERLIERVPTDLLIVSVIGDTLRRCEFSYRYASKPYFEVVDGALELRNVPVPSPGSVQPGESRFEGLARSSHFADLVMRRIDPQRWVIPETVRAHRDAMPVSRLLVRRLARIELEKGIRVLLVVQWMPRGENAIALELGRHAERYGLEVLATQPALEARAEGPNRENQLAEWFHTVNVNRASFLYGHMTGEGNRITATLIRAALASD